MVLFVLLAFSFFLNINIAVQEIFCFSWHRLLVHRKEANHIHEAKGIEALEVIFI